MFFLAQTPPAQIDYSIPIQPKIPNYNGSPKIDLFERNLSMFAASSGYGKARTRWIQKNTTNNTYIGTTTTFETPIVDQNWQIKGVSDFGLNDNTADILWRNNATGENAIWLLKRSSFGTLGESSKFFLTNCPPGWDVKGLGDYDNDGKQNILWYNKTTGQTAIWTIDYNPANYSTNPFSLNSSKTKFLSTVSPDWDMVGWADMNQDNIRDIVWQRKSTGETAIWELTNTQTVSNSYFSSSVPANSGWQIEGIADFNSDGINDIVWRNQGSNDTAIWRMKRVNNQTVLDTGYLLATKPTSADWQLLAVADTNGNGVPDLIWSNNVTLENAVWEMQSVGGVPSLAAGFLTPPTVGYDWRYSAIGH